jgi:hypothetical protein
VHQFRVAERTQTVTKTRRKCFTSETF